MSIFKLYVISETIGFVGNRKEPFTTRKQMLPIHATYSVSRLSIHCCSVVKKTVKALLDIAFWEKNIQLSYLATSINM